jgi:flagellar motility protein MotE (MotC chaperone)/sporulation protein YlmC with PRC-barrel domain
MAKNGNHSTTASALLGSPIADATGALLGRVREMAVAPALDASHVYGLILKPGSGRRGPSTIVYVRYLDLTPSGVMRLLPGTQPAAFADDASYLLIERDLLDQQIIDVHGHKVVRVNDVDLVWESPAGGEGPSLRIAEVEVGARGAVRRLLRGLPTGVVESIAVRFTPSPIPWNFVDLIERDPARRVRLKVEQDRLAQIHPSDLADILEELAPAERQAVFTSLDEEVAAETLEEVEPKLQKSLVSALDSEQVAGIVEEMDPAAAADLLAELPEEKSEAILEEMDPEERQEVEELLEFSHDSAAGLMTTGYVALPTSASVDQAIAALRDFEGDIEPITDVYLLDQDGQLTSLVPVVRMLLASPETALAEVPEGHLITCHMDANGRKVAELFDKYNLRSLPVVDEEQRLVGVVHAEQVIALLRANH